MTTEQPSAASLRAPAKASAIALLLAAVVGVLAPITAAREGMRHVAYQDFARRVWTICNGHTGPTSTPEWWRQMLNARRSFAQILRLTPSSC